MPNLYKENIKITFKVPTPIEVDEDYLQLALDGGQVNFVTDRGQKVVLGKTLSKNTGEGNIYEVIINGTHNNNYVAKIYKPEFRTKERFEKIKLIIKSVDIDDPHICWPESILYLKDAPIGFIMKKAKSKNTLNYPGSDEEIDEAFPGFCRTKQVDIILDILNLFNKIHSKKVGDYGVLLGDIKADNILVDKNYYIYLVDMDSVQIGEYPCVTGTPGFNSHQVIGCYGEKCICEKNQEDNTYIYYEFYRHYLRSYKDECFSIAVLLFRILFMNYLPYENEFDIRDGVDDNYVKAAYNREFPYDVKDVWVKLDNNVSYHGSGEAIWSHLPSFVKQAFHKVFKLGQTISVEQWISIFEKYRKLLDGDELKAKDDLYDNYNVHEISIDYKKVIFMSQETEISFTMEGAVKKLIKKHCKDHPELNEYAKDIALSLKKQPVVTALKYNFKVIFNIGIIKKIEITCKE